MSFLFAAAIVAGTAAADPSTGARLPALSREWHSAEYQIVAQAIDSGAAALPMLSNARGEALLRKITSADNLALAQNKNVPVELRMREILALTSATQLIAKPFFARAAKGEKVNAEAAALLAFMLRAIGVETQVMNDYVPTIPRDEKYAQRMEGLKIFRAGCVNVVFGVATSISERQFYSADDISLMLSSMADTMYEVKGNLQTDARAELARKLDLERKIVSRPSDIKSLDRVLAELGS